VSALPQPARSNPLSTSVSIVTVGDRCRFITPSLIAHTHDGSAQNRIVVRQDGRLSSGHSGLWPRSSSFTIAAEVFMNHAG
jgi:hypothetical protein